MAAIDEILATIRRLPLPERLRLIEQATLEVADEFLAARLTPSPAVGPVSLQDMDRAIAEGGHDSPTRG